MVRQDKKSPHVWRKFSVASGEVVKHALFRGNFVARPHARLHVPVAFGVPADCTRACCPLLSVAGVLVVVILAPGLHVNLSASAPRGLYRTGRRTADAGGVGGRLREPAERGARTRARLSRSRAVRRAASNRCSSRSSPPAGDVVWRIGPEEVTVNGQRLLSSSTAAKRQSRARACRMSRGDICRSAPMSSGSSARGFRNSWDRPIPRVDLDGAGVVGPRGPYGRSIDASVQPSCPG